MERKKIIKEKSSLVKNFASEIKSSKINDISQVEELASKAGFTNREAPKRNTNNYNEIFSVRCIDGMNDIISDISYMNKIKKQHVLEEALYFYLKSNNIEFIKDKFNKCMELSSNSNKKKI